MRNLNLLARFLLELCALAAFAYWGWETGGWPLALLAPLAVAVVWAVFLSPKAPRRPRRLIWWLMQLDVFTLAAVALGFAGRPVLAVAFGLAVLINNVLLYHWDQEAFGG